MMHRVWFGILAAALTNAAAQPADSVSLLRLLSGSEVTIGLDDQDEPRLEGGPATPLEPGEMDMLLSMLRDHPDAFGPKSAPLHTDQALPLIIPERIRFRFIPLNGGSQSVLVIENGLQRSFMYKARIGRGTRSMVTDVCQVVPSLRGIEHWPYPIDWIEISDIHVVAWNEGDRPRCE